MSRRRLAIEDHGVIGDPRASALVGVEGDVYRRYWNPEIGCFTGYPAVDASTVLLPLHGFASPTDLDDRRSAAGGAGAGRRRAPEPR